MRAAQEKINPARLGFDFDGVIADTAEAFLRLACDRYGLCDIRLEDIVHFEVERCLDIEPRIVERIFTDILLDSIGTGLRPMDGAVEVLGELSELAELTVVTARSLPQPVHDWMAHHLPPSALKRIHLVAMGSHDDKTPYIRARGLRHFIDDRAETCTQLSREGISPIVFHQPWNANRHNLPTVRSWKEIRALCLS